MNTTDSTTEQTRLRSQQRASSPAARTRAKQPNRDWTTPEFEKLPISSTQNSLNDGSDSNYS